MKVEKIKIRTRNLLKDQPTNLKVTQSVTLFSSKNAKIFAIDLNTRKFEISTTGSDFDNPIILLNDFFEIKFLKCKGWHVFCIDKSKDYLKGVLLKV